MSTFGMNLRVTTDSKQGGRKYMEDMISIKFKKSEDGRNIEYTYLAVFDGHGGSEAAKFAKEHLLDEITKQTGFWSTDDSQVTKAIKDGFLSCHNLMQKDIRKFNVYWPKQKTEFRAWWGIVNMFTGAATSGGGLIHARVPIHAHPQFS